MPTTFTDHITVFIDRIFIIATIIDRTITVTIIGHTTIVATFIDRITIIDRSNILEYTLRRAVQFLSGRG
jgi:hypothetical protein